jgi:hypothetical protein
MERGGPQQSQLQLQLTTLIDDLIQSDLQQLLQPGGNGSSSHGGSPAAAAAAAVGGWGAESGAGDDAGYLQGRVLWLAAKLVQVATPEQKEKLLQAAVQGGRG